MNFNFIPDALRYPGAFIEIDASQAGLGDDMPAVLLVGQKLAAGNAPVGEIIIASSVEDVMAKAGGRSMLADMMREFRAGDQYSDVFILPLADPAAGVAATATITVTTAATADGTLQLYIDDRLVSVAITATMTTANVATAIAAAINAAVPTALLNGKNIPCDAAAAASVVTLTALHKGTSGNSLDLRTNMFADDRTPTSLGLTISGFANGTGDPAVPNVDVLLEPRWFKTIVLGNNNTATLTGWHAAMLKRYQPPIQQESQAYAAHRGDYAAAYALGDSLNHELLTILSLELNPVSTWRGAAMYAAACSYKLQSSPGESLEGRLLTNMKGVKYHTFTNANSLLFKGISIMEVDKSGACYVKRPVSTYQERSDGSADDSYLDINTIAILGRIRYVQRTEAIKEFRGSTAAKSSEGYAAGLRITTKDSVKALLLRVYKNILFYQEALVQDYPFYKENLYVEQDQKNPSRFNFRDTPVIVSPFYNLAGQNQFRKVAE